MEINLARQKIILLLKIDKMNFQNKIILIIILTFLIFIKINYHKIIFLKSLNKFN